MIDIGAGFPDSADSPFFSRFRPFQINFFRQFRTLRQKLGPYGSLIQTVRNVGYRLEEQG